VHLIVSVPGSASVPCRAPLFSCRNNRCALKDWVFDGKIDCGDGSDEGQSGIGAKEMAQKQVPTPSMPIMHSAYSPYFKKKYKFLYFSKINKFPIFSFNIVFNLGFYFPHVLIMTHLRIMLYTYCQYWAPLHKRGRHIERKKKLGEREGGSEQRGR